ncbi:hypothetical protein MnBA_41390 [Marinobacterium sp. BA1]
MPTDGRIGGSHQWLCNKEMFEVSLLGPLGLSDLELNLYDYCEPCHKVTPIGSDMAVYSWQPARNVGDNDRALFFNYFGMAEIRLSGVQPSRALLDVVFEPLEVVVDERDADKISRMFDYLARQSPESLYQAFSATPVGAGHQSQYERPSQTLERLESTLSLMAAAFPSLIHHPITRLVPESTLVSTGGQEYLDDAAIGWLMENMSVLSPAESAEHSHLLYQGRYFVAEHMVLPVLHESTDLYENQIIHGFVALLLSQAHDLLRQYSGMSRAGRPLARAQALSDGFVSFFTQMRQFREHILGRHLGRCEVIVHKLQQLERELRQRLPVKMIRRERPYFTQKVQMRPAYREIFSDIIRWHERGQLDWSAFENLFSIESLPTLFEHYCFFRTAEAVTQALSTGEAGPGVRTDFSLSDGTQVRVLREPHYWMPGHEQERTDGVVNSEGFSPEKGEGRTGRLNTRSTTTEYSRRSPDVVIEILKPGTRAPLLLVMDAKHTHPWYAFTRDLPSLTMKYVHGIHSLASRTPPVVSLTIIHPLQDATELRSFHGREFDLFSEQPVQPSLQCLGIDIVVQPKPDKDALHRLIRRLFEVHQVSSGSSDIPRVVTGPKVTIRPVARTQYPLRVH